VSIVETKISIFRMKQHLVKKKLINFVVHLKWLKKMLI